MGKEGAKGLIPLAPAVYGRQVLLRFSSTYSDSAFVTVHIEGDLSQNRVRYPSGRLLSLDGSSARIGNGEPWSEIEIPEKTRLTLETSYEGISAWLSVNPLVEFHRRLCVNRLQRGTNQLQNSVLASRRSLKKPLHLASRQ